MSERHEGIDFGTCCLWASISSLISCKESDLHLSNQLSLLQSPFYSLLLIQSLAQFLPQLAQIALPFSRSGLPIWTPSNVVTFLLEYDNCKGIKNVRLGIILLTQFRIGLKETGLPLPNYSMLYTYGGEQCTNARAQTNHVVSFYTQEGEPLQSEILLCPNDTEISFQLLSISPVAALHGPAEQKVSVTV